MDLLDALEVADEVLRRREGHSTKLQEARTRLKQHKREIEPEIESEPESP